MNSKIGLLSLVLLLQVVILAWMWLMPASSNNINQQLLDFQAEEVTRVTITDGSDEVQLEKQGDAWQVGSAPADGVQVDNILNKLANLSAPWPVATSSASAQRFEVDNTQYQRLVRLYRGETQLAELYLGTSPSYQRVHARRGDDNRVYSVALSNFELAAAADNWIDKGLFALEETPEQIEVDFVDPNRGAAQISKTSEGWLYNGAAADSDVAQTYANRFTTLRVLGLATPDEARQALATINLEQGDIIRTYVLSQVVDAQDEYRIAKAREQGGDEEYYRLATYIAEQLLMTDADFSAKEDDTPTEEVHSDVGEG